MTPLQRFVRAVGYASLAIGGLASVAPREVARCGGVRTPDDSSLPVLVRLAAARQISVGLALLTRTPPEVARAARLFLPLTALDAAAVLAGVRRGGLAPRSAAMALTVLGTNAAVALAARRP